MRLPWVSLLLVAAGALVMGAPAAAEALVYDRALVDAGEWWRLVTAHLVHFGWAHFGWDACAIVAGGALAERDDRRAFGVLLAGAALLAGVTVHVLSPELARYAGLSALAYAALAFAALAKARDDAALRPVWLLLLGALAAKLVVDAARGAPMLWDGRDDVRVAGTAHLAGVVAALAAFVLVTFRASARILRPRRTPRSAVPPRASRRLHARHACRARPVRHRRVLARGVAAGGHG